VANILERQFPHLLPDTVDTTKDLEKFHINDWIPANMSLIQEQYSLTFVYPEDDKKMLKMPYGYPYVQFNLEVPITITQISLRGNDLSSAKINITFDDPEDLKLYNLGQRLGNKNIWYIQGVKDNCPVKTIRINASFTDNFPTAKLRTLHLSVKLKES